MQLTVESALNAATSATNSADLQYASATQEQIDNVYYHDIAGQAAQSIHGSKLRIANEAEGPIYINYLAEEHLWPQTLRIDPGMAVDYHVPVGKHVEAARFWPKYGCDEHGQNCTFGESGGPGLGCPQGGCSPPIDSKFEATFGASDGNDWYNASQVDGWSLPFSMNFDCQGSESQTAKLNCSGLKHSACPTQDVQGLGNVSLAALNPNKGHSYAGCYSPCSLLTHNQWKTPNRSYFSPGDEPADQYCCAGAFGGPEACWEGPNAQMTYTDVVHSHCDTYAWAYDDAVGLKACPSENATFSITYHEP